MHFGRNRTASKAIFAQPKAIFIKILEDCNGEIGRNMTNYQKSNLYFII